MTSPYGQFHAIHRTVSEAYINVDINGRLEGFNSGQREWFLCIFLTVLRTSSLVCIPC